MKSFKSFIKTVKKSITDPSPSNPLTVKWVSTKKKLDVGKYTLVKGKSETDTILQNGKQIGTFKRGEESDEWVITLNKSPKPIYAKQIDQFEKKIDKS